MFRIKYNIIKERFIEIEKISDEVIQYDFLLGNLILLSSDKTIEMKWEWIPLLDFAYCLKRIVGNLKVVEITKEYFEFTENVETLEFLREREQLKIIPSFSSTIIVTKFAEFEKAVYDFHFSISEHIRRNISNEPSKALKKYLSNKAL
jgi:hypothetical protein